MEFNIKLEELELFAEKFWQVIHSSAVFAFHGEMGAGKTTLISALCRYKGVEDSISSPTFSIINEYSFIEDGSEKRIFHIDLYRLKNRDEIIDSGVEDCIYSGNICMIEWPEKAPEIFDERTVHVFIKPISETERNIDIKFTWTH